MSDSEKVFITYSKLTEMIDNSRKEKTYCACLVVVLNEISKSEDMVILVDSIINKKATPTKIIDVINESSDTLNALFKFVQLV